MLAGVRARIVPIGWQGVTVWLDPLGANPGSAEARGGSGTSPARQLRSARGRAARARQEPGGRGGIIPQPPAGRHRCHCSACKGPVIFKKTHFEADWSLSEQISCSFS